MNFISNILHPQSNAEEVLALICQNLKVRATKTTLSRQLLVHPYYPSLKALNDVLSIMWKAWHRK